MSEAQGRGRGRARARAKPPTQGVHEAPRAPPGMSQAPRAPPGMSQAPPAAPPQQHAPPTSGRAMHRGTGRPVDETTAGLVQRVGQIAIGSGDGNGGNGGNGAPVGRGNMRGKRQIYTTAIKTRPEILTSKKGSAGQQIKIQANYFCMSPASSKDHNWCLHQYRVDFAPELDLTKERKDLLRIHRETLRVQYMFDGTMLFCSELLTQDKAPIELFSARESDGSQVRITIRLVGELMLGDWQYMQFFNLIIRNCFRLLKLQIMNRDYFDPAAKVQVTEFCLELWPGYKTTIRQHEKDVLMCAEITHKVMRTDTCLRLLRDITDRNRQDFKGEFTKAVVGSVVLTDYNNQTYVVTDVDWNQNPRSTFDRQGTATSFIEYFKQRYNITIKDGGQPLLVSKAKARQFRAMKQQAMEKPDQQDFNIIRLIPELCRLTGLTDDMRNNFNLMRAMAAHTRIGPGDRINRLMTMNHRMSSTEGVVQEIEKWNLKLAKNLVDIPARVLPQETIVLGNNVSVPAGDECDWTRHLRSNPMFVMPQGGLTKWVIIYPNRVARDAEAFVDTLYQAAKGMRFNIEQPEYIELNMDNNAAYLDKLDQAITHLNPQLILVVVMNNKGDRYAAIKKKSLVDRAVPTQVIMAKNLNKKGVMSIATKVAIQMNCKVGGAPWSVNMPLGGLMVIGFDVCHDSKSKAKSYGAMVASLNKPMSRYFSAVSHHAVGEELSNDLALNVVKALQCYRKHNNTYPSHIILYRDGVGDGQIPYVFNHEVGRIVSGLKEIYGQTPPKLAVIVVCKRINTRLFYNKNNPRPGTVVDDVITLPERYDFFIVSQFVNQGTVSPTSYNVIHDTVGLDADKLQRLTYKLTHCYYNWSGTVRVPAPVQYAHKLAFLVSQSLHRAPNTSLEELLFFL